MTTASCRGECSISSTNHDKRYNRILLKLSGEQLMGDKGFGIDPKVLDHMVSEIRPIVDIGVQVGLVIGGGNLFRGAELGAAGLDRVTGDHMGMLATVMNALAMCDALQRANMPSRVMSSIQMSGFVDHYNRRDAVHYLQAGEVVIFAAGTGNPFFTTDSAACLRGIEVGVDLVLKATKVDGVYNNDPLLDPTAQKYVRISYDQVLEEKLAVMDLTAICLCQQHNMPLRVFKMDKAGALSAIIAGVDEGTLIDA